MCRKDACAPEMSTLITTPSDGAATGNGGDKFSFVAAVAAAVTPEPSLVLAVSAAVSSPIKSPSARFSRLSPLLLPPLPPSPPALDVPLLLRVAILCWSVEEGAGAASTLLLLLCLTPFLLPVASGGGCRCRPSLAGQCVAAADSEWCELLPLLVAVAVVVKPMLAACREQRRFRGKCTKNKMM